MLFRSEEKREKAILREDPADVHKTVRDLRMDLWRKHFALGGANGLVQPASEMASLIEKPAAKSTIQTLKQLAANNARSYREVFPFVPWSDSESKTPSGASLWPVCPRGIDGNQAEMLSKNMPFHDDFWLPGGPLAKAPSGLKGHFVKLQIGRAHV